MSVMHGAAEHAAEAREPDPGPVYRVQSSLFSPDLEYRLAPDALIVARGATVEPLPYREIERVRLEEVASGFGRVRRCVVYPAARRKRVLQSAHYLGLARFEDRSATYEPFVRALLGRVVAANPGAVLEEGHGRAMWFVWLLLLVTSVLVVIGLLVAATYGGAVWSALPAAMFLLTMLPTTWRAVRTGWPRPFDPARDHIP